MSRRIILGEIRQQLIEEGALRPDGESDRILRTVIERGAGALSPTDRQHYDRAIMPVIDWVAFGSGSELPIAAE
ncbi:hypothetical protein [Prosthecomicrobium pneumaticum]|uniref:Uncharacterized protein n=1 Tax=Prosthecomicrobium pneumaticum TaxID=81895 RepID=A0A7W9FJ99_9HYPH|nr:hypothetical protein [Prosthecomicrobium pneumaticum]MBB5751361.1 hypothetical protein [Prosthecomicrobium pneumaticum]